MATHPSDLAWEIPWIEEFGGLQSMGLQKVGHDSVSMQAQGHTGRTGPQSNVAVALKEEEMSTEGEGRVKTEAETGAMSLHAKNSKGCWQPPEAGRILPSSL